MAKCKMCGEDRAVYLGEGHIGCKACRCLIIPGVVIPTEIEINFSFDWEVICEDSAKTKNA